MDEDERLARSAAQLKDDPDHLRPRTPATSCKYVHGLRDAGVPIDYLTVQNEPQNRTPDRLPGHGHAGRRAGHGSSRSLGPLLQRRRAPRRRSSATTTTGRRTRTTSRTPRRGRTRRPTTRTKLLQTQAAKWIAGHGLPLLLRRPERADRAARRVPRQGHLVHRVLRLARRRPTRRRSSSATRSIWHARTITIGMTRNWSKITSELEHRARRAPAARTSAAATPAPAWSPTHPDGTVTTNAEYYTIGHLSKFVEPGAVRIASTSFGTTGWNGQIMDVAFRNPDGSTALVVHNENDDPRSFAVSVGDRSRSSTRCPAAPWRPSPGRRPAALDDDLAPISLRRRHGDGVERGR